MKTDACAPLSTTSTTATDDGNDIELMDALATSLDPIAPPLARQQVLRQRLNARISASVARHVGVHVHRAAQGNWSRVKAGVIMKLLHDGQQGNSGNSVLIRLTAGASLPVHRHRWVEEGIVLDGTFCLGGETLMRGDYHLSQLGSRHERITSPQGGTIFLRGVSLGSHWAILELLGGLLPHRGASPVTQHVGEISWTEIAAGVQQHVLRHSSDCCSRLIRMSAGTRVPGDEYDREKEYMMIEGDAFFDDMLLCAGDYHKTPAGRIHNLIESERGALFFVHSTEKF